MKDRSEKFQMFPPGTEVYVQGSGLGVVLAWETPHEATVEYHSGFVNTVSYRRIDSAGNYASSSFKFTGRRI